MATHLSMGGNLGSTKQWIIVSLEHGAWLPAGCVDMVTSGHVMFMKRHAELFIALMGIQYPLVPVSLRSLKHAFLLRLKYLSFSEVMSQTEL